MILIAVRVIEQVKFTTDSRRLCLVIHDHTSSNPWSFKFEAALGYSEKVLCFCVFTKLWSVLVTLVYIR